MENLSSGTNGRISFLNVGIYHILSLKTEFNRSGYRVYYAKVRRLSDGCWIDENVDLAYLFTKECKSPIYKFQAYRLVNQVIEITSKVQQTSSYGKYYYSYNWEFNTQISGEYYQDEYDEPELDFGNESIEEIVNGLNDFIASSKKGNK